MMAIFRQIAKWPNTVSRFNTRKEGGSETETKIVARYTNTLQQDA